MNPLNRHPFAVRAFFDHSLVLGFCLPKEQLQESIPPCLELDLVDEQHGFLAVAMVQTRGLRPKRLPRCFGRDFMLIGYRIFVRYRGADGRRLRGLYILGSETENPAMRRLGAVFTQYRYQLVDIDWQKGDAGEHRVHSDRGLKVEVSRPAGDIVLPDDSLFADWRAARRFAGPMPFTFSFDAERGQVIIVEGMRSDWKPQPVQVDLHQIPFFEEKGWQPTLANAFLVEDVPYEWKRGRVEDWNPA